MTAGMEQGEPPADFDLVDEPGHPTRAALDRVVTFTGAQLKPGNPAEPG